MVPQPSVFSDNLPLSPCPTPPEEDPRGEHRQVSNICFSIEENEFKRNDDSNQTEGTRGEKMKTGRLGFI